MSAFAFSHQFSQHWTTTLPAVKNTIIQELDDIAKLLQPNTVLADYQFSVPNLDTHIEDIITQENARLAKLEAEQAEQQRLENERLEQERLALEQAENARLEQQRREQIRLEHARLEQIRLEKERLEQQRLAQENRAQQELKSAENKEQQSAPTEQPMSITPSVADSVLSDDTTPLPTEPPNLDLLATQETPHHSAPTTGFGISDLTYEKIKQEMTANLTQQMEDYIQDSMQMIRDELRPWLEAEVKKQLEEQIAKYDS